MRSNKIKASPGSFSTKVLIVSISLLLTSIGISSPLIDACKTDNPVLAQQLITDGADINLTENDGTTALMWASHYDHTELALQLIEAGANIHAVNEYGSSAILEAMLNNNNLVLDALLNAGVDPDWTNPEGESALMIAARSGNVEGANILIGHGANINLREQWGGQTALMWAAAQNQPALVALLIANGADINLHSKARLWDRRITSEPRPKDMNKGGFSALHYAAREDCVECIRQLVAAGARLNATDPDRVTPLNLALLNLHFAAAATLIDAGADIDKWDIFGRSPLYMAIDMNTLPVSARGDIPSEDSIDAFEIAVMLLEKGANPNIQLKMRPPYREAVNDRRSDHILSYGATPLFRAAKAGDIDAIKLLLEYGAIVDLPNWMGLTPLMAAAGLGRTEEPTRGRYMKEEQAIAAIDILLEAGANINARTLAYKGQWATMEDDRPFFNDYPWDGQTALHGAAKLGWTDVVEHLVKQGAVMQVADINGKTALDLAYGRYDPAYLIAPPLPLPETITMLEMLCQSSDTCQLPTQALGASE